jgi:signal transduction histidine kinase
MALRDRILRIASGRRLPRRTVRLRLTLLYGVVFLLSGVALLATTYFLLDAATGNAFIVRGDNGLTIAGYQIGSVPMAPGKPATITNGGGVSNTTGGTASGHHAGGATASEFTATMPNKRPLSSEQLANQRKQIAQQQHEFETLAHAYQGRELHQLLVESGVALGIMALVSVALGYVVGGRILRPLRVITATTRDISASNLDKRLALHGPDDELKELGDTIDGLLARLDASFRSQRQFVANASHELRTPLARQRTLAQVALADPAANVDSLRDAHERILASGEQQEQLIDALLTLSRVQAGAVGSQRADLAPIVSELLAARAAEAESRQIRIIPTLIAAPLRGDPRLVERLAANLIDNALRHNVPGGLVVVQTGTRAGHGWLAVTNDGPEVDPDEIERLYEPFERLGTERTNAGEGHGLGLCIVRAVAIAHGASLTTEARLGGGLHVEVRFPPAGVTPERDAAEAQGAIPAGKGPAGGRGDRTRRRRHTLVHAARSDH